jgi:indole-3-glycerol phosphate synthase
MPKFLQQITQKQQEKLKIEKSSSNKFINMLKNNKLSIIGEVKFTSPSAGELGSPEDLLKRVIQYQEAKINAISIITESYFFKGDKKFIHQVKQITSLPILQKDFVIDPYQIYESKLLGADALLIIARLVNKRVLKDFVKLAKDIGVEPVVEVFSKKDLEKAVETETNIIAVNARDLDTFSIDLNAASNLLSIIPKEYLKLGFSGIKTASDIQEYKKANTNGILIGTSLMRAEHIHDFLKSIL